MNIVWIAINIDYENTWPICIAPTNEELVDRLRAKFSDKILEIDKYGDIIAKEADSSYSMLFNLSKWDLRTGEVIC